MKVLSAGQIREVDAYTIQHEPIASIDLMEKASLSFTHWFKKKFDLPLSVCIISGTGNNGGDGLAVGRILMGYGYEVKVYVVGTESGSEDFQINLERLSRDLTIPRIAGPEELLELSEFDVLIDGIFGSGLSRPAEGLHAEVIETINQCEAVKVSIDISSGLYSDMSSRGCVAVEADFTFSFQLPKLAFLMPENDKYVGDWEVGDIGLDTEFIERQTTDHIFVTQDFLQPFITRRSRHGHKGSYGKGLLVTGGLGKIGASVLASRAFMRSGAGLLTTLIPRIGYQILQTAVPEAMVITSGETVLEKLEKNVLALEEYDAIGIGPGIGTDTKTADLLEKILQESENPKVIDADGLNILAKHPHLLKILPPQSILTPHPKEFERLAGASENDFDRMKRLSQFAKEINGYVVLKGAYTALASPDDHIYFNSTGNPGMATGGSGDVLTGVITSLLAQHLSPFKAAVLGVYIHGLAGGYAAEVLGEEGMIASDIIENLPQALQSFH